METIRELWRGEISLPRTYWLWGSVIYGLVVVFVGTLMIAALVAATGFPFLTSVWQSFIILGGMFMNVAIWRSAGNYQGPRVWTIVARIIAVLSLVGNLIQLLVGLE